MNKRIYLIALVIGGIFILSLSAKGQAFFTKIFFDVAWWGYSHQILPGDFRSLSPAVHKVGYHLIHSGFSFQNALENCTQHFRGGCLHGVVMAQAETLSDRTPESLRELCGSLVNLSTTDDFMYFQCVHGVGHILGMEKNINKAISGCTLFLPAYQEACASGVFMEYAVSHTAHSHHDHFSTVPLPCDSVPDAFKKTCYISEGFYRHYLPSTNDFDASYIHCATFFEEAKTWCIEGVDMARKELQEKS